MSQTGIMFFLAVLPVVLILLYVYNKDRTKEPLSLLIKLFFLGICSCFLVLIISGVMGIFLPFMNGGLENKSFLDTLLYAFIGVALVEEFSKWIMLYFKGYRNDEFDELYDILVYAVFVSLGFAFFENILYIFGKESLRIAILRAISAVPSHACDAIFMGYYLNIAKQCANQNRKDLERKNIFLSIIVPTILHGIYDFCLMSGDMRFLVIFLFFVIELYTISLRTVRDLAANNKKIKYKNLFCSVCGTKVEGPYCANCGAKNE